MAGLFNGTVGSIIGFGFQTAFGAIPISEDASKALDVLRQGGVPVPSAKWFSPKPFDKQTAQSTKQVFDQIAQHVTGAMQVLGPCMQIARALEEVVYPLSQPAPTRAGSSQKEHLPTTKVPKPGYDYRPHKSIVTPQPADGRIPKSGESSEGGSCFSSLDSATDAAEKTKKVENPVNRSPASTDSNVKKNEDSCAPPKVRVKIEADGKVLGKDKEMVTNTVSQDRDIKGANVPITGGITENSKVCQSKVKKESKVSQVQTKVVQPPIKTFQQYAYNFRCELCNVLIRTVKNSSSFPCGHFYCYHCVTGKRLCGCPKCNGYRRR